MDHLDARVLRKPAERGIASANPTGSGIVERGLHQAVLGIEMASTAIVLGIIAIAGLVAMLLGLCLAIPRFAVHWLVGAVHKEASINSPLTPVPGSNSPHGAGGLVVEGVATKKPAPVWPYSLLSSVPNQLIPSLKMLGFGEPLHRREKSTRHYSDSTTDHFSKSQMKTAPIDRAGHRSNASPGLIPS